MLKYLIIQLDDTSVSFCHYDNHKAHGKLLPLDTLKEAIFWTMKENLNVQFVYPEFELPADYKAEIAKTFHADIVPATCQDAELLADADVVVFDSFNVIELFKFNKDQSYVFRTSFSELFNSLDTLVSLLPKVNRINIVITDILSFKAEDEKKYEEFLNTLAEKVADEYKSAHFVQLNLLTDRILLDKMNNCNAGDDTITLCPDGNFYVCPAFYADSETSFAIGSLATGLDIKNSQLYKLDHAPICRICDAYQCRRCVWFNRKSTLEVNTPSHEQCFVAHLERKASRRLLNALKENISYLHDKQILELDYLDPFDQIVK